MAVQAAIYCENIGSTNGTLNCCYPDDQASPTCRRIFAANATTFSMGCLAGNCIRGCQKDANIYKSLVQDGYLGADGRGPIRRFQICSNVPAMAGYLSHQALEQDIASSIANNISSNATGDEMSNVTSAITDCLTQTCWHARRQRGCSEPCSAVNMLVNSTIPNVQGINDCLLSLCSTGYDALPYADADVVGIGVFASYIAQCMLVVLLWFGLSGFEYYHHPRRKHPKPMTEMVKHAEPTRKAPSKKSEDEQVTHHGLFENFLVQFHKSQCYFSATLQIACLSFGIFETDMLHTFMLTPIATNGVLPIVFAFVLLLRCGKASMDVILLTTACWLLSSIVYWILYASIIPINQDFRSEDREYRAYQQFMYKLSAIDACGGYSALAACPNNFDLGKPDILRASDKLSVLTPLIWSFSTICLLITLAFKLRRWLRKPDYEEVRQSESGEIIRGENSASEAHRPAEEAHSRPFVHTIAYVLVTMCFLAGIGMQLSLLSIATSLKMMNRNSWSFGQIVAVTIWAPPVLGYVYDELKKKWNTKLNKKLKKILEERRHHGQ